MKLLIVAKNPGHPMAGESDLFRGRSGDDLFRTYRQYQEQLYGNITSNRNPSTRFHKTLFRYVRFFLDIPDAEDVYEHVAHTKLVKCSTPGEQDVLGRKTMNECYGLYLRSEIALLRPKVVLALGREVERFLVDRSDEHGVPVIYVKHPSYRYKREDEAHVLTEIKRQIVACL